MNLCRYLDETWPFFILNLEGIKTYLKSWVFCNFYVIQFSYTHFCESFTRYVYQTVVKFLREEIFVFFFFSSKVVLFVSYKMWIYPFLLFSLIRFIPKKNFVDSHSRISVRFYFPLFTLYPYDKPLYGKITQTSYYF